MGICGTERAVHTWSDEWSVGPVDQRSEIIGFIVRAGDVFEVTMLSGTHAGSSFGSLLSAIDFITHTLPPGSDAFGTARRPLPIQERVRTAGLAGQGEIV